MQAYRCGKIQIADAAKILFTNFGGDNCLRDVALEPSADVISTPSYSICDTTPTRFEFCAQSFCHNWTTEYALSRTTAPREDMGKMIQIYH